MRILFSYLLITASVLLAGCSNTEAEKTSDFIPDIPVACTSGQAADCAANALPLFIGIIDSTAGADCDDFLTGMTANQRQRTFLASGNVTTGRQGLYLTGTVSKWVDTWGTPIASLTPGEYFVCALIDTNGNGVIDTNEPVGTGLIETGSTNFMLTDWSAAYN